MPRHSKMARFYVRYRGGQFVELCDISSAKFARTSLRGNDSWWKVLIELQIYFPM